MAHAAEQVVAPNIAQGPGVETVAVDSALHRAYELTEMRFNECAKLDADGALVGVKCSTGCVLFGPYAAVPKDSDLRLSFDIEAESPLILASDMVSDGGNKTHGTSPEHGIQAQVKRQLDHKVHFTETTAGIEARLWIRADNPTSFKITNFKLQVL